ncbi:MAG: GyrI-like domain-containing protein [Phycisphaerae bacterium]|nr:GyrI-like domain-containing protein [Tepidisphaeraceae bacterium]
MRAALILTLSLALLTLRTEAADPPKPPAPDKAADVSVGETRVMTFPAVTFIHAPTRTTFADMVGPIEKTLAAIEKGVKEKQITPAGSAMFVYRGVQQAKGMNDPFDLEVGWVVADDQKPLGDLKVRKADAFKCLAALYQGPVAGLGAGYGKVFGDLSARKLEPTGEHRELYLHWEGKDSPNNVVWLLIGIK